MKNILKFLLLALLILTANLSKAQIPANNNRYIAYAEVYPVKSGTPNRIQVARNLGCNAINFTIDYRAVHGFNPIPNVWASYDSIMVKAKSLNMKIGIRILVDNACLSSTLGAGTDNNAQICSNIQVSERMLGKLLNNGGELVHQQSAGPSPTNAPEWENRVMTSLAAQSTKDRIALFTNEILNRYKSTYLTDILWMNVAYTSEQEGGYPYSSTKGNGGDVLFDYSPAMVQGFRVWLQLKYGTIAALNLKWSKNYTGFDDTSIYPKIPQTTFKSAFEGNDGKDWWSYRTKVLRDATEIFVQTVRSQTTQIRVISDYGSVYDVLSLRRGTYNFKDINTNTDGVKTNDAPFYDHRFATDLIRSNMPGKFIANEVEYSLGQNDNCFQQFRECFDNGANWVNIFQFQKLVDNNKGGDLTTIANTYVGTSIPSINPTQNATFKLSSMLTSEGCSFSNKTGGQPYVEGNGCSAYTNWKAKFSVSNGPVNIILEDDISEAFNSGSCNVPLPNSLLASPSSVTSGGTVILSGTCPAGSIVWNTPNGTATVSPIASTVYTAKCVIIGTSSPSSNSIAATTASPVEKVLILGNSIVSSGPDASIGWGGNWGMAASEQNKTFVSLLTAYYKGLNTNSIVVGYNVAGVFETNYKTIDVPNSNYFTDVKNANDWTTIIIRLGENISTDSYDGALLKQKLADIVAKIANGRTIRVIISNCFWTNSTKDATFKEFAVANNYGFADLTGIYTYQGSNTAWNTVNNAVLSNAIDGVKNHPGDAGMLRIANKIINTIVVQN